MSKSLLSLAVAAFVLGGCSLIPDYQQPEAPVAGQYPQGLASSRDVGSSARGRSRARSGHQRVG